jgi:hypothetical protein
MSYRFIMAHGSPISQSRNLNILKNRAAVSAIFICMLVSAISSLGDEYCDDIKDDWCENSCFASTTPDCKELANEWAVGEQGDGCSADKDAHKDIDCKKAGFSVAEAFKRMDGLLKEFTESPAVRNDLVKKAHAMLAADWITVFLAHPEKHKVIGRDVGIKLIEKYQILSEAISISALQHDPQRSLIAARHLENKLYPIVVELIWNQHVKKPWQASLLHKKNDTMTQCMNSPLALGQAHTAVTLEEIITKTRILGDLTKNKDAIDMLTQGIKAAKGTCPIGQSALIFRAYASSLLEFLEHEKPN